MKRLLDEARRAIRISSVTKDGNEELANYLMGLMQDRGLRVINQQVTHSNEEISKRQFNIVGILGDNLVDKKIRKGLLLNTHIDTVGPGLLENWTETAGDPWAATIKEGKIFGLGTADVKIDFLCKLHAIEKFREKKLKMPIYLVGTCGEEMGMFGAKYLIKSLLLNPKYVVVGEPSNLEVVHSHKALALYKVTVGFQQIERDAKGFSRRIDLNVAGRSAHSAYPEMGINAIDEMFDFVQRTMEQGFEVRFASLEGGESVNKVPDRARGQLFLTSHQFEDFKRFFREIVRSEGKEKRFAAELGGVGDSGVRFLPECLFPCLREVRGFFRDELARLATEIDSGYNPPVSTHNFGTLKQRNRELELHFDLRILPQIPIDQVQSRIETGLKAIASKYPPLNISVVRERTNPGLNMTMEHSLVQICEDAMKAAGIPPKFQKKSTSTEAAQYFQAGYEAVVFGPGMSQGNSHSPNEHNLLAHLDQATIFYEKVIERTCL